MLEWRDLSTSSVVGRGVFATVIGCQRAGRCVKVERALGANTMGTYTASLEVAERMGKEFVGPRVHAWRVITTKTADIFLVSEMDRVPGITLGEWRLGQALEAHGTYESDLADMTVKIVHKIRRMNALGVRHNDLNLGNVLVDNARSEPWIIDYTFSTQHRFGDAGDEASVLIGNLARERGAARNWPEVNI